MSVWGCLFHVINMPLILSNSVLGHHFLTGFQITIHTKTNKENTGSKMCPKMM